MSWRNRLIVLELIFKVSVRSVSYTHLDVYKRQDIIRKNNGWKYHLLTEDIEFSVDCAIQGEKIGYSKDAVIYDEQPTTFRQSWIQRLRWSKGFYQVFGKYSKDLVKGIFKGKSFACYDMLMTIAPASLVSLTCLAMNLAFLVTALLQPHYVNTMVVLAGKSVLFAFVNFYVILFAMGVLTTITEWKQIKAPAYKKVLYTFTFPVFIFTYVPISIVALFKNVQWTPITHSVAKSVQEMK